MKKLSDYQKLARKLPHGWVSTLQAANTYKKTLSETNKLMQIMRNYDLVESVNVQSSTPKTRGSFWRRKHDGGN
jgi:hypothetical protein